MGPERLGGRDIAFQGRVLDALYALHLQGIVDALYALHFQGRVLDALYDLHFPGRVDALYNYMLYISNG